MKKRATILLLASIILALLSFLLKKADSYTSTNEYCNSCHVHGHAHASWIQSTHHLTSANNNTKCIDCHLPPKGEGFYTAKIKAGIRDLYAYHFKDSSEFNWHKKSQIDIAIEHTFKQSCLSCHSKLFPVYLSKNGEIAHWHYIQNKDEMHCIHCHINVGHGGTSKTSHNLMFLEEKTFKDTIYKHSASISEFSTFTETIPNTDVSFKMVAIDGGSIFMNEKDTSVNDFYIGEIEVSWNEYLLFLSETESEGRAKQENTDGISGATPPWGNPDQGWGLGMRPAITMTHHAASVYCEWLSLKTGKHYRLPSELEWEYTAIIATEGTDLTEEIVNANNSRTLPPNDIKTDDIGIKHLFGNVKEFCFDKVDDEHIIKGGSFKNDIKELSPQWRERTQHKNWLKTDPQIPKSIWWYSDCNDVGFRVVLSYQNE